jgi:aryl-alcohol dehydrogenase-like predicted oxidoreductase
MLGGIEVGRIGLGTNRLTTAPEHVDFVKEAVATGVNLVDTAHIYTGGESEQAIGTALSPLPDGCIVATKGGFAPGHGHPHVLGSQIDQSLRRLRIDSIPLYYLHRVDPETRLEESLGLIREYQERGKIRHVGLSQVGIEEIKRGREIVEIAAVQNHYNLSERQYEDVVDFCAAEGIVFVPYFPLHGSGGSVLADIAKRHGATPAQIKLAWLLKRSPTMLPIPGTLSPAHLRENLGALEIDLGADDFERLS